MGQVVHILSHQMYHRLHNSTSSSTWLDYTDFGCILCGHPIAHVNVQLDPHYAASKHTTAPINHTRHSPVSIHQTASPVQGSKYPITAYYSIYRPRKDERLSWPSWLTCSGRFNYISGHPSAAGRVQGK